MPAAESVYEVGCAMPAAIRVFLSQAAVRLRGGEQAELTLTVQNDGALVASCRVAVLGGEPRWFALSAESLAVWPGEHDEVRITLSLPADLPGGVHDLVVQVFCGDSSSEPVRAPLTLEIVGAAGPSAFVSPLPAEAPCGPVALPWAEPVPAAAPPAAEGPSALPEAAAPPAAGGPSALPEAAAPPAAEGPPALPEAAAPPAAEELFPWIEPAEPAAGARRPAGVVPGEFPWSTGADTAPQAPPLAAPALAERPAEQPAEAAPPPREAPCTIELTLDPPRGGGPGDGSFRLRLANRGAAPWKGRLEAVDPAGGLYYLFDPFSVTLPAGQEQEVELRVRPKAPLRQGEELRVHAFVVDARPDEKPRPALPRCGASGNSGPPAWSCACARCGAAAPATAPFTFTSATAAPLPSRCAWRPATPNRAAGMPWMRSI